MRLIPYAAAAIVGLLLVGSLDPWSAGYRPDIVFDKEATVAAWTGDGTTVEAPRTPAALLLQGPVVLAPDRHLRQIVGVVSVAGLLAVCWVAARLVGVADWWGAVLAVALMPTPPIRGAILYGNSAVLVAGVVAVAWLLRRRPAAAGFLLAAAASLKLWPLAVALVIPDVRRWAVGWFAGLNVAGLALPGVTVAGQFAALSSGGQFVDYAWNLSAARLVGPAAAAVLGAAALVWVSRTVEDVDRRVACAVIVGLAAVPLSWPWYWVAAIPAAAVLTSGVEVPVVARRGSADKVSVR